MCGAMGCLLYTSFFFPHRVLHRRARLCYSILWASEFTSLNYPFDFAFFAHVTPGRCPAEKVPEIFIPLPVAEVVVDLGVAGLTKTQ